MGAATLPRPVHPDWCPDTTACERERDHDGSLYHLAWVGDVKISDTDDGPEMASVALSRSDDPDGEQHFASGVTVQQLLDGIYSARPVERTRVTPEDALDEAIARCLGGGHGQRRSQRLEAFVAARQALETQAEREARQDLAARINADLDASGLYGPEAEYRTLPVVEPEPEQPAQMELVEVAPAAPRTWAEIRADFHTTHVQVPASRRRRR